MSEAARSAIVLASIRVERQLTSQPDEIFAACADIGRRMRWRHGPDEHIEVGPSDFRVGGTDRVTLSVERCTVHYDDVIDDEQIVMTERTLDSNGDLSTLAVGTWTLTPTAGGTLLRITDQTTSIVGSRPVESLRYRYETMLDRLQRELDQ